jgi:hypothetical protein
MQAQANRKTLVWVHEVAGVGQNLKHRILSACAKSILAKLERNAARQCATAQKLDQAIVVVAVVRESKSLMSAVWMLDQRHDRPPINRTN